MFVGGPSRAPERDARLTSVVSIPKSSKVFLYIGRLLLALFETNRTFLPAHNNCTFSMLYTFDACIQTSDRMTHPLFAARR